MTRLRRAVVVFSSALVLLALSAGPAFAVSSVSNGDTTVSLTTDMPPVIGPETRLINATVTISTGKTRARLELEATGFPYTRTFAGRQIGEGLPLRFIGLGRVDGPVTFFGGGGGGGDGDCSSGSDDFMPALGIENSFTGWDFQLPANSTASIVMRYEIVADPPWENTNYSPKIVVGPLPRFDMPGGPKPDYEKGKWSEFKKRTALSVPRPAIALPLAARVDVDFSPRPTFDHYFGYLKRGQRLTVKGSLVPARAGYPINLWIQGDRKLATVTTDAAGKFSYAFTPKGGLTLVFRAEFPGAPGADLAPDPGCEYDFEYAKTRKAGK